MNNQKVRQITGVSLFVIFLGVASSGYLFSTVSNKFSLFLLAFIGLFFVYTILIYLLSHYQQTIKDIMLSLFMSIVFIIALQYGDFAFKTNFTASIYILFAIITIVFGIVSGLLAVIYGIGILFLRAYIYSLPLHNDIFYAVISTLTVLTIGLILKQQTITIKYLRNQVSMLREAPVKFNIIQGAEKDNPKYSEIISEEGLKKERSRLMTLMNERLFNIVETIRSAIHSFTVILYLIDKDLQLKGREILSNSEWINMDNTVGNDDTYIGWVLKNRKSVLLNEMKDEIKNIPYYTRNEGIKSFMAVPVIKNDDVIGIICADSLEVQAFTDEHVKILTVIANQIVDLMDNMELQYRLRYDMYEKGAMYIFVKNLSSRINSSEIGTIALQEIKRITNMDTGIFALRSNEETFKIVSTYEIGDNLIDKEFVIDTGMILGGAEIKDVSSINQFYTSQIKQISPSLYDIYEPDKKFKYVSFISLLGKEEEVGLIILFMEKPLSERLSIILNTLISQIAISLYNSILFDKLEKLSITDGLTGLYNHRHFQGYLDEKIREGQRYNHKLSVVMMDIDHFKTINDTYGHPFGDTILRKFASIIMQTIRDVDYAARYGGEEFVVVLPNTDTNGAFKIIERLRKKVEAVTFGDGDIEGVKITISIGVACFSEDAKNKQELIEHSDNALYYSKENGRNKTTIYANIIHED